MKAARLIRQVFRSASEEKSRDLILAVLRTTTTKREARQYIGKYGDPRSSNARRVSVIRLSASHASNYTKKCLGRTLSLLRDLGANPLVVLDTDCEINRFLADNKPFSTFQQEVAAQANQWAAIVEQSMSSAVPVTVPFRLSTQGMEPYWGAVNNALRRNTIPILCPLVYDSDRANIQLAHTNKALKSLVQCLETSGENHVDKLVFIDPAGGVPSAARMAAHLLVNMMQEYDELRSEIMGLATMPDKIKSHHLENFQTMRELLDSLPSSATGIITTPEAAGAVLERNPIIYNLLTDRPLISPSLPVQLERTQLVTSVLRKGFPTKVLFSEQGLDLAKEAQVGNINLTCLEALINSSFGKRLDLEHYLDRIKGRVACAIIVGDYDGAAIVTWETSKSNRRVAYLDKFAVNPKSQGAAGVADIMLIVMLRRLFRNELVWRSRANNPVNKWYFERSTGFLRIPDSQWIMFWNSGAKTPPIGDYAEICKKIEPSFR